MTGSWETSAGQRLVRVYSPLRSTSHKARNGVLSITCRDRHCLKCQASAARRWLAARQADLLPVDYYHLVFTLPAPISEFAYYNKSVVYDILFKAVAETLRTIAADPRHLGARIGVTLVLHTWGSAMTHHPHVHGIVPGGGLSLDGERWVACRPGFFLPVRVLSKLFRRLFLEKLSDAHRADKLQFLGEHQRLAETNSFSDWLKPLRQCKWVVYAKRPFAGPAAVLAYLSRYTHRVAIANTTCKDNLAQARELLMGEKTDESTDAATNGADTADSSDPYEQPHTTYVCPDCGAPMFIIDTFLGGQLPRAPHTLSGGRP